MWPVAVDAGWCPTLMPFAGLVHATLVLCVWPAKSSQLPSYTSLIPSTKGQWFMPQT